MSVLKMAEVWARTMPPTDKLTLLALADWADDEGWCWPSIATVAKKTGVSERTVQYALRSAENAGLISRVEYVGKGCRYQVLPEGGAESARVQNGAQRGAISAPNTLEIHQPKRKRLVGKKKDVSSVVLTRGAA